MLRAATGRLARGQFFTCASAIGWTAMLSTSSKPASNLQTPGGGPQAPGGGASAPGGGASAPGAGASAPGGGAPAQGGEAPTPPMPSLRLTSFGGPTNCNLRDTDEFFQENDVLRAVPADRLTSLIPGQPYLFPDLGRWLFRMSLMIPFVSHRRGRSSGGVFEKPGNVGIIEEFNAFGLKDFFPYEVDDLTEAMKQKNYQEARDFVVGKVEMVYGKGAMNQFPAFVAVSKAIDTLPLNELKIINNVAWLSREDTATLVMRIHDCLVKDIPYQRKWLLPRVSWIYRRMPYTGTTNNPWLNTALADKWFINWIDDYDLNKNLSRGKGLLKLHRHGCNAHWMEEYAIDTVATLAQPHSLTVDPITKDDIRDHFENYFSEVPTKTYDLLEHEGLDGFVNINGLFYTPSWYS